MSRTALRGVGALALGGALTMAAIAGAFATPAPNEIAPGPDVTGVTGVKKNGTVTALSAFASPVTAIFVTASAADEDQLVYNGNVIFDNKTSAPGAVNSFSVTLGPLDFVLNNLTTGASYTDGVGYTNTDVGAFFPVYHFADFRESSLASYNADFPDALITAGSAADTAILANGGYSNFIFVGVEDLAAVGSDDWNDLIFAFSNVAVPEPGGLLVLATSLAGLLLVRRRQAGI